MCCPHGHSTWPQVCPLKVTTRSPACSGLGDGLADLLVEPAPGHVVSIRHPLPGAAICQLLGLSNVSGANDIGEPNGEPTVADVRPCQATTSHGFRS